MGGSALMERGQSLDHSLCLESVIERLPKDRLVIFSGDWFLDNTYLSKLGDGV